MTEGISNTQIDKGFNNIGDEDIDNNFLGVFPSNYINKFIDHAAMISEIKGKHQFIIAITDSYSKGGHTGRGYSILSQKQIFSSLVLLALMV